MYYVFPLSHKTHFAFHLALINNFIIRASDFKIYRYLEYSSNFIYNFIDNFTCHVFWYTYTLIYILYVFLICWSFCIGGKEEHKV